MKIINSEYSELMFDITPEETLRIIRKALKKVDNHPTSNDFSTTEFVNSETDYSFTIGIEETRDIKERDIISVEAVSSNSVKVKLKFSNRYVESDLLYLTSRKKIEEQTFSIIYRPYESDSNKYYTDIVLDDSDKKAFIRTHEILESEREKSFRKISESDFINKIIDKSEINEYVLISEPDWKCTKQSSTRRLNTKRVCFLINTGLICNFTKIIDHGFGEIIMQKLTNKAMILINCHNNKAEFDLNRYIYGLY